jgi:hypothetical protein
MIAQKVRDNLTLRPTTEEQRAQNDKSTVWVFVWTLFVFKMVTLIAIVWAASGSTESIIVVLGTNWYFLLFPAIAIAGPLLYYIRIRRVRRRREAMMRAEWMLD